MAKILIVDDSPIVREQMKVFLDANGHETVEAESGEQGLQRYQDSKPDIVVCDFSMPGMNGLEMIRNLRSMDRKIPVFMLTTEASPTQMEEGRRVGTTAWMVKPFKPRALLAGIKKVTRGR